MRITHWEDEDRVLFEHPANSFREGIELAVSRGVDLTGADLMGISLSGFNLREAKLTSAVLDSARCIRTNFRDANLEEADLEGSDIRGAMLWGTNLEGSDLRGVKWDKDTDFDGARFTTTTKMDRQLALHVVGHHKYLRDQEETEKRLQELKNYLEEGRLDQARRVFRSIPGMYPKVKKTPSKAGE